ncbi:DUF4007 family protein [Turneriella parva]|uniref:DUF4007 domain-containing protein n=1 Tax=Turneriella parva (strain ATCC BAA-1111 / DSM 21527 / NCTC 11395 / H) TaxID=869212 RepID=I4B6Q0_TURPD|nr:DUF4007 family protein [Turneriella parva]AFM12957.1 hypothetical protein Turpa_2313 [Turneriella parva DSM 21527]
MHRIITVLVAATTAMRSGGAWSSGANSYTATFARHETFHPRYGWLKKGVDLVDHDPVAFASDDVHMNLGVGKNMAHAIRYWCEAFGLIVPLPSSPASGGGAEGGGGHTKRALHQLTHAARDLIAGAQALDPYIESTATLWWLHYQLLKTEKATTWNFAIDHFGRTTFTADELEHDLRAYVRSHYSDHKIADSSLAKDVHLFLRMYAFDESSTFSEDSIDSPFIELGLLQKRGKEYTFVIGAKPTLPDAIIAAACLDYAGVTLSPSKRDAHTGSKSISFTQLMQGDLSPVKAFRLTENSLYEALERTLTPGPSPAGRGEKDLYLSDTAGVKQLAFKSDPLKLAHKLLKGVYRHALS